MPSSSSSQKPSWLADLLDKDAADIPTPPSSAGEDSAPTDWSKNVTVGKGTLADDSMSGSIMMLLDREGFRQKIEAGAQTGHVFSIIHNAPSTEFLMIESWQDNGETRKSYHAFSIKSLEPKSIASVAAQEILPPHPIVVELRYLDQDIDRLLALTSRFAK